MLNPLCCNSVAFALFLHSIRDIPAQHSIRGCKAPYLRSLVRVEVVPLAYQRLALERHIWRARRKASLRSILTPQMEGLRVRSSAPAVLCGVLIVGHPRLAPIRDGRTPSTTSQPCPVIVDIPTKPPSGPPGSSLKTISPASASCSQTVRILSSVTGSNPPKFMSEVGTQPPLSFLNGWIVDRKCALILAS
jgi:hypothetical protein